MPSDLPDLPPVSPMLEVAGAAILASARLVARKYGRREAKRWLRDIVRAVKARSEIGEIEQARAASRAWLKRLRKEAARIIRNA